MKKIVVAFFIISLATTCFAQFSAGGYVGLFHGFNSGYKTQYGVSLTAKYDINKFRVGGNIGYYVANETSVIGETTRYTTPFSVSAEYVFLEKDDYLSIRRFLPHAGMELGFYRTGSITNISSSATSNFGGGPTAGAMLPFSKHIVVDALVKYHLIFRKPDNLSVFSAKIGILYYF